MRTYELDIDHKTVLNHLHKAGYEKKLVVRVPHDFNATKMMTDLRSAMRC